MKATTTTRLASQRYLALQRSPRLAASAPSPSSPCATVALPRLFLARPKKRCSVRRPLAQPSSWPSSWPALASLSLPRCHPRSHHCLEGYRRLRGTAVLLAFRSAQGKLQQRSKLPRCRTPRPAAKHTDDHSSDWSGSSSMWCCTAGGCTGARKSGLLPSICLPRHLWKRPRATNAPAQTACRLRAQCTRSHAPGEIGGTA
mmetsp:Transcript_333/g.621  ORF Transcript_333/g.621 Transcript_333/m.621 type:complete len:201 (-) Transcript_333:62-664(-)